MYDVFFVVYDSESIKKEIRVRFPLARFFVIDENSTRYDVLCSIQKKSLTKMFWIVDVGYEISENFNFDYVVSQWDEQYAHIFKEEKTESYKGVYLLPKSYHITKNESEHLFFINKKEIDITVSRKKNLDIFYAVRDKKIEDIIKSDFPYAKFFIIDKNNTVQDALTEAQKSSSTEMFWFVDVGYAITSKFDLDYVVPSWDRKYVHVFKEEKTDTYKGLYLIPKSYSLTKKELEHIFFINKKEIPILGSKAIDYEVFIVKTYDEYLMAKEKSVTDMFYIVFSDLKVSNSFKFNDYIEKGSRHLNYVYKNGDCYDGLFLTSNTQTITEREFNNRFLLNRTEVDVKASEVSKYETIFCKSYEEFLEKIKNIKTDMAYVVTENVSVENFSFDYQVPKWNQDKVHVFKNGDYFDGIFLISKNKSVSQKEFNYRFFINKIEVDILASKPNLFDIVFISYSEPNADENYQNLLERFPRAKRIHGVKGIHQAHKEAAKIVDTSMFWVVDGDAEIVNDFNFDHQVPVWDFDTVHVWRSQNPINGLQYGYGGVKLLPTELTRNLDINSVDMTTSISSKFKPMPVVSNLSKFNTDPFNTWRSAFRECVKLSSKIIKNHLEDENQKRLEVWCTVGEEKDFGEFAIKGALSGKEYGLTNANDPEALRQINDWEWLTNVFNRNT